MEVGKTFGGVRYVIIIRRGNMERNLTKELLNFLPQINFRYKKKILVLNSPICSKAKEKLSDWRILWF